MPFVPPWIGGQALAARPVNQASSAPPVIVTTWNPADKAAGLTLSNLNLTALGTLASATGARGTVSKALASGAYHFEITCNTSAAFSGFGLANTSATLNLSVQNAGTVGIFPDGSVAINNIPVAAYLPFGTGDVIAVEYNTNTQGVTFQILGQAKSIGYNASPIVAISNLFPLVSCFSPAQFTANFGAFPFQIPPTAGFVAWDLP